MYCLQCGASLSDNANFCNNCGTKISNNDNLQLNTNVYSNNSNGQLDIKKYNADKIKQSIYGYSNFTKGKEQKKKNRNAIIIMLGVFCFFVIILNLNGTKDIDTKSSSNNLSQSNSKQKETTIKSEKEIQSEYIAKCKDFSYNDINRNPSNFVGLNAKFTGKVIQISESWSSRILRVEIDSTGNIIYVRFRDLIEGEARILENDFVHVYGELSGVETYTALLGNQISLPAIDAKYIIITDITTQDTTDSNVNNSDKEEKASNTDLENSINTSPLPLKPENEVLEDIKVYVEKKYADNKSLIDYEYENETEAYYYMLKQADSTIKEFAYNEYTIEGITEWSMVRYIYDEQLKSYNYFQNLPESKIKEYAFNEYTEDNITDWSMAEYIYDNQMKSYINLKDKNISKDIINEWTDGGGYTDWNMVEYILNGN